jgi:hypothetical protein
MPNGVASSIVVFGRGLDVDSTGIRLSAAGSQRVHAVVSYIEKNQNVFAIDKARLVFAGGWGAAAEGMQPPPHGFREAELMLELARELGINGAELSRYADARTVAESSSTLEDVLRTKEAGYFDGVDFTAASPLGLVAHDGHLDRITYLVGRVFSLPPDSLLRIAAAGEDHLSDGLTEKRMLAMTRLAFVGAHSHSSLRRRHLVMLRCHRVARSFHSAG